MNLFCSCGRVKVAECCWRIRREAENFVTCQRPICAKHAKEVAPGKFLCPEHETQYDKWRSKHPSASAGSGEQQSLFQTEAA